MATARCWCAATSARAYLALPSLNKVLVLDLARLDYVLRRENVIALGNSGTGKTHVVLGLGLAACQKGLSVAFTTAAALVHELTEARDEKRLLRLQRQLAACRLLVIDELGYVPFSQTGAELLFEVFSQRYERGSTIVTSNLPSSMTHCLSGPPMHFDSGGDTSLRHTACPAIARDRAPSDGATPIRGYDTRTQCRLRCRCAQGRRLESSPTMTLRCQPGRCGTSSHAASRCQ